MPTYRFAFEVTSGNSIPVSNLRGVHADMEKYLRTVLLPKNGEMAQRANAEVANAQEDVPYAVHIHETEDRCPYCMDQAVN